VSTLLGVGSLCGVSVGLGVFLGVFVDGRIGTSPLFAIVGLVLGVVCAAYASYQVIRPYVRG
jgi:F0F1-type ATP synthase assembly protein I